MINLLMECFNSMISWAVETFGQMIDVLSDIIAYLFSAQL